MKFSTLVIKRFNREDEVLVFETAEMLQDHVKDIVAREIEAIYESGYDYSDAEVVALAELAAGNPVCVGRDQIGDRLPDPAEVITVCQTGKRGAFEIYEISTPNADTLLEEATFPGWALDIAFDFLTPLSLWLDRQIAEAEAERQKHDDSCFFEGEAEAGGKLDVLRKVRGHLMYEQMRDGQRRSGERNCEPPTP